MITKMNLQTTVENAFRAQFGGDPTAIIRAPGRVNLIGEHTDYNDGFVLPMAIDRAVWIALRPRADAHVRVYSIDYGETALFSLTDTTRSEHGWAEYMKGVAWALHDAGYALTGWDGTVTGDVPRGAGLSSSAAIELATARALTYTSGIAWDAPHMARLSQRAENEWVGVKCGIMDQMISAAGEAGHALLIDCRTLETQSVPLPTGTLVVVLDTMTRRGLVDSAYNERRAQCEAAAAHFGVKALRDVSIKQLSGAKNALDPVVFRRARHVITENMRTLLAADAMRASDAVRLGTLMNESHISLRDDFEVSSDALNVMVTCALAHPAAYGARMTGAGFGGCAVALVDADRMEDFTASVGTAYQAAAGRSASIYVTTPSDGARVM